MPKETPPPKTPAAPEESPRSVPKKSRAFKRLAVAAGVFLAAVAALNVAANRPGLQRRVTAYLDREKNIGARFGKLSLNLFTGIVSGDGIALDLRDNKLSLSLKRFEIQFTPLYLLVGRLKINAVAAEQIHLDTSAMVKSEKKARAENLPDFLKHIRLRRADIDAFFWDQGEKGYFYVDKVRIASKFGTLFYRSPTKMTAKNLRYVGDKVHFFADALTQDGFFIFDLSQPRILDESKIASKIDAQGLLFSFAKRRKPWLTNPGWDADLEPKLKKYYGDTVPDDRSYLYVGRIYLDFEKKKNGLIVNALHGELDDAVLKGSGNVNLGTGIANLKLKTEKPMPFSKLPLGQAQIRQAFEKFSLDLDVSGTAASLEKHKLKVSAKAAFLGNKIDPKKGDAAVSLKGELLDTVLSAKPLEISIGGGQVAAEGSLRIKEKTAGVDFTCRGVDAVAVIRLFSSISIPAVTDCRGSLTGKLNDPRLEIAMTSDDAGYEFLHFGPARGELLIERGDLKLDVTSTSRAVGQSDLKLTIRNVFDNFNQTTELATRHEGVDVRKLLAAKSLDGSISGVFNLRRVNNVNDAKGEFAVRDFLFFGHEIGDIDTKLALRNKHLTLAPLEIELAEPQGARIHSAKGFEFDFDAEGYRFAGLLSPELSVKGTFRKSDRQHLDLKLDARDLPLKLFTSLLPFDPRNSSLTGAFDVKYHLYEPSLSQMQSSIKKFLLQLPEGEVELVRPASLGFSGKAFQFKSFEVREGHGLVTLNGALGVESNSNLRAAGRVDFNAIADFNPFISESEKPVSIDLTFKGDIFKPQIYGKAALEDDAVTFRNFPADLTGMTGAVAFDGNRIAFGKLKFLYDDAPMELSGHVATDYDVITAADAHLTGTEVPLHLSDGMNLLTDLDVTLRGSGTLTAAGKINIVEGQYNREFGLADFILKPRESDLEEEQGPKLKSLPDRTQLKLAVKNTGDLVMKNNMLELEMRADLELVGTIANPAMLGQIDFVSGTVNALGIDFEDATGYAQFRRGSGLNPDVNLVAKKEIQEYEIQARLQGQLSNLRLKLDSTPSLDRRDILAILFYGQTPDQLVGEKRHQFTQTAAISQLASVLSKPINKISGLDVVEVSSRQEGTNQTVQRLSVGKKLSNRLNLKFTTDLGIDDPERAFELEYQVFDHFYLIAAKDVGERDRYRLEVSFKFEAY